MSSRTGIRGWLREIRIARARRRLLAAMAYLDQALKTAGVDRRERRRIYRALIAESTTFTDLSDLQQVIR